MAVPCLICCHNKLIPLEKFAELPRVSSDSRPMLSGGRLVKCEACGALQKKVDHQFQAECEKIYADYLMYPQSSKFLEPFVFDCMPCGRSSRLITAIAEKINLHEKGSILDVGCGNGNLLRAFSTIRPEWKLSGLELDGRYRSTVEAMCGQGVLNTGKLEDLNGKFDLITAIHVLEHLNEPVTFLKQAKERLSPDGYMLLQLPLWQRNPFDLLVADHCMHYDWTSLFNLLRRAGLKPAFTSETTVPREITLVARTGIQDKEKTTNTGPGPETALIWLAKVRDMAAAGQTKAGLKHFGVFGTGNASMWLTQTLGGVSFYVDEDPTRQGINALTGKTVYSPEAVPEGSTIFICLSPDLSASIKKRLCHLPANWVATPPLEN